MFYDTFYGKFVVVFELGIFWGLWVLWCGCLWYLWFLCEGFGRIFWGVFSGFWMGCEWWFWSVFGGVLKIFFCEVSETTIPSVSKYEQIVNVKLPPCKYRKYFNFLIWSIQKLTVSHFLIPTILICFIGIFNCKLL